MTIFDPISGRQITIDPLGKPYRSITGQDCFTAREQQARAGQTSGVGTRSKSSDLPTQRQFRERIKA
ncbi:hypothetical protein VB618_07535 [Microvirga sp. CF3062]|uniref:hypothetical protein n=1 Tax=Microvirga sp. CF3062 TaxID=3110182 RepID=UPI002E7850B5|nr:hypothetical protein [Microvirga sp. CF3062]MEE1656043.1 hypothetical protein [Microvirga sp. CF3062]